ncbi:MAG: ubiquinone biosynthesis regulatory protein kinase UbiB [Pseudomonadota bacterium]|nr:ubiquinone biosynthesis regulatory protein kinase UbiB [Pseudomonadota bacterium]
MFRATLRILQATRVVLRYRLDDTLFRWPPLQPFGWIRYILPWHWRREERPLGMRLRLALEELGPVAIKLGQALATRRDLLPLDVADELARLQDRVPPFPGTIARRILEETYGAPVERIFDEFSETPLAAASIAQVHAARLKDGRQVVVKLLRPGVEDRIRQDLRVMYLLANFIERFVPDGRRLHAREVIADYEKTILDELDLVREGANAAQTRRNFEDRPILYVPLVHWEWTRRHVLVMERIHGIPISDIAALKARGVNFRFLAERGVEIFFTQVFRHNFFHADMHAGNIFVDTRDPQRPGYLAVDFGIVGTLGREDQRYIAHNIYAFFNGDYRRVAELHVASGWVRPDTCVEDLESVIRTLCEPILFRPFKDIHLDQLLLRLFEIARRFDMEVQPQLVLLQKTLVQIEGLGRQLYPDLDLWSTAKPFMERWMREQLGPRGIYREFKERLPDLAQRLPLLPLTLDHALQAVTELPARQEALSQQLYRVEQRLPDRRSGAWTGFGGTLLLLAGFIGGVAGSTHAFAGPPALLTAALLAIFGLFSLHRARRT